MHVHQHATVNNGDMQVQSEAKHGQTSQNLEVDYYGELQSNGPLGHVPARGIINTWHVRVPSSLCVGYKGRWRKNGR